ncbi:hypothetical protein AX16_005566 [Volvariella volvacea WC 439]|nr:hypothetical protein AX16_005566 [Volvariella volvacea WC 439]
MNGLDDLRGWTLNGAIQSHIDVYVSHTTFVEVQRSFPYLVSKEFASGGGDVPEFKWHIINDKVPFEILDTGIMVTPFAVHHGRIFSVLPPPAYTPTPTTTSPSTPTKTGIPLPPPKPEECPDGKTGGLGKSDSNSEIIHPYLCYGFKIENQLIYISDVSHIPEDVWPILTEPRRAAMVVLDCLRLRPHTSHFGLQASIEAARRIGGVRTYLTGFDHAVSHEEYVTIGEIAGGDKRDVGKLTESERAGAELVGNGQEQELWVRPAYDGLRVFIGGLVLREWTLHTLCRLDFNSRDRSLMKFFSQSFLYDDPWSIVSLAFFLRYPNPYAAHVVSCDVISREQTPQGTLVTSRLILKRGALPRWAPKGIVSRAESWIIEESEVDPFGKTVRCRTRNLDHVKVMQVEEWVHFKETPEGKTMQTTEARILSGFGWGLTKKIESHGLARFKANVQRSREGVSLILSMLRQGRLQPMALGAGADVPMLTPREFHRTQNEDYAHQHSHPVEGDQNESVAHPQRTSAWTRFKSWFAPPPSSAPPSSSASSV